MFEQIFEMMPIGRSFFEKLFHKYDIHPTSRISRGVKIIYKDKKRRKLKIGKNCFIGVNCLLDVTKGIIIGDNVQLAPNVLVLTHDSSKGRKKPFEKEVIIEDNAFIGAGSILLPGVKIGKKAVVGAGSVVTKNVKPNMIVVGNPAKLIKKKI
jgi:maltose O-acetyltransferase